MIPLRVRGTRRRRPYAVCTVVVLCLLAMLRLLALPPARAASILDAIGVVPARLLAAPSSPGQMLTLVTAGFLHVGWLHLAGNVLFLAAFGPAIEARAGTRGFVALYAASGIAAGLAHCLSNPGSNVPLVGASGAIAGVLGAHLVLEPRARVTTVIPCAIMFEVASLPAAFVVTMWFAFQVGPALASVIQGGEASVSWMAHIAGFAAGVALAAPLAARDGLRARARRSARARRPIASRGSGRA